MIDPSGTGLCQVSVDIDSADMDTVRAKEAAYLAEVDRLVTETEGKTPEEKSPVLPWLFGQPLRV